MNKSVFIRYKHACIQLLEAYCLLPNKMFFHSGMNITSSSIFGTEKQSNRLAFCKVISTSSYETTSCE